MKRVTEQKFRSTFKPELPEAPLEMIAEEIKRISEGIKKLRESPLNEKALLLLIQHAAAPATNNGGKYSQAAIKDILKGVEDLADTYIKKEKK